MDLLQGINKGVLAVLLFIIAAVAVSSDDPLTRTVLGIVFLGALAGFAWDPVFRLLTKYRRPR
ncbi:hypothetical protein D3C71_1668050 [compost metagenome]